MTLLRNAGLALILVFGLGSAVFAEDKVYKFDKNPKGINVQVRCTNERFSEDIKGVFKIVFSDSYIHIETKNGMFWFPKESVQRIRWYKDDNVVPEAKDLVKKAGPKKVKAAVEKKFPTTARGALKQCIALLKAKKYEDLVKDYLHPEHYKKMEKEIGLKVLVEGFTGAKADGLLAIFEELAKVDVVDEVAGVATFKNKAGGRFEFHKVGERWYIKN